MIYLFLCSVQWFSKQCLTITWIITGIKKNHACYLTCPWISFHFRNVLRCHCRASIFVLIYLPQAWNVVFVKFRQFLTANSSNDFHRSIKWVHIEYVNTHFAHMCLLYPVALLKISPVYKYITWNARPDDGMYSCGFVSDDFYPYLLWLLHCVLGQIMIAQSPVN